MRVLALISLIAALLSCTTLQKQHQGVIQKNMPFVAFIENRDFQGNERFGSGFCLSGYPGLVMTNYHLISKASSLDVLFASGIKSKAKVIHVDDKLDLAVLEASVRICEYGIEWSRDRLYSVGTHAIALGNPAGFKFSASSGMISSSAQILPEIHPRLKFIQVDVPMEVGSSGGPLVDLDGRLIGINTRGSMMGNFAFAVSTRDLLEFLRRIPGQSKPGVKIKTGESGIGGQ